VVIAHRGASGYLPEHTLEAVTLAHMQGADFIEQDIVLSKDLVPVVLHDIHLETVSDVEQKFPARKREDGRYYAFDFSLAELKTLRVHERESEPGKRVFSGRYQGKAHFTIATFEEEIELITELNRQFGKNIGFYPEIKSPAWHRKEGADISKIVLAMLRKHQLDDPQKAIYVQCFDFAETQRLRNELGAKVKLVQLIGENNWGESDTDYVALRTPEMLAEVAKVAQGIGPWIPHLVDLTTQQQTLLAQHAKQAGLSIHPFTFRKDDLPVGVTVKQALDTLFKDIKVDGVFSDFPDVVIDYLNQ
jgi:glycerophosphoryl diester phosphodiesterase